MSRAAVGAAREPDDETTGLGGSALAMIRAIEHFPYGILLVDRDGRVAAANGRVQTLLGREPRRGAMRCCDLLGCGTAAGPPQGRCVTELALGAGEQLPEMRLDIGPDDQSAVWVSAAPAPGGVCLSLRPGQRGDRRRRTEPHWVAGPRLRIRALGPLRVSSGEASLDGGWTERRTGKLLKFLVAERHRPMHADRIVHALWPTAGADSLGALRQCVHALRDTLEPGRPRNAASSFVLARSGGYALDPHRVWIDADEFESLAAAGLTAAHQRDARGALVSLTSALELYRGDFLGDEPYAEWAFAERDRLRDLAGEVLRAISGLHLDSGELDTAAEYLQRLAQVDPYDVDIQRQLIGLYIGAGRRSQAVRRYERLRQQMQTAFGETLNFELRDLADEAPRPGSARRPGD
ncbi:MAG: winged helix-turn-helix domain-containing protein [Solirubrobacterales bacterium]|nr:winged helix-turn-helix domain-containing protein [Solirubrobacterales bacterium]